MGFWLWVLVLVAVGYVLGAKNIGGLAGRFGLAG